MRIIDAHLHFAPESYFDKLAAEAGHENSSAHLAAAYEKYNIAAGVVMGNFPLERVDYLYPENLYYCAGIDGVIYDRADMAEQLDALEKHLQRSDCVGIKFYPGYRFFYVGDDRLAPVYELAAKYDKPVAVHTGLTASDNALLKYSHPLTLDEAAVKFPKVRLVMCHFGEPWFDDAAAVVFKNPNVSVDLSGMLEGKIADMAEFLRQKSGLVNRLKDMLAYLNMYDRFMFGTDWPLANLGDYIEFVKAFVPEKYWEPVFHANAERVYGI